MKLTKSQLKEMILETVKTQLNEMSEVDSRMAKLDHLRTVTGSSSYDLLEGVLEMLDDEMWHKVITGLKYKYGYKF